MGLPPPRNDLCLLKFSGDVCHRNVIVSIHKSFKDEPFNILLTQSDGQALMRLNACQSRVERELAHGDAHAARSQVTKTQDTLSVCHYNGADVALGPGGQTSWVIRK